MTKTERERVVRLLVWLGFDYRKAIIIVYVIENM